MGVDELQYESEEIIDLKMAVKNIDRRTYNYTTGQVVHNREIHRY